MLFRLQNHSLSPDRGSYFSIKRAFSSFFFFYKEEGKKRKEKRERVEKSATNKMGNR